MVTTFTIEGKSSIKVLYEKYRSDLSAVCTYLAGKLAAGAFVGNTGTFDLEGEVYYLLMRESGARTVLEVGPGSGYSTLYLASAVRDNGGGVIHCLELAGEYVENMRQNVVSDFPFVRVHQGDCVETFNALDASQLFDLVLLDAHRRDLPQFAAEAIFPRARGLVAVDDVVPDARPWTRREGAFYLWFLIRGDVPFLPLANLSDDPEIAELRAELPARTNTYKGTYTGKAKAVVFNAGPWNPPSAVQAATALRYDDFQPEDLTDSEKLALAKTVRKPPRFSRALQRARAQLARRLPYPVKTLLRKIARAK